MKLLDISSSIELYIYTNDYRSKIDYNFFDARKNVFVYDKNKCQKKENKNSNLIG